MHVATGPQKILHQLHARLASADDQHAAFGELADIAVLDRMHLENPG